MTKASILLFCTLCYCSFCAAQSEKKNLSNTALSKLIPEKIKGFSISGESKCIQSKIGTLRYGLCERKFVKRNQTIKILLFDYANAPIMYDQATRKWSDANKVESDSIIFRSVILPNGTGWESYHKQEEVSQVFLGISNRFYLTITANHIDLETLDVIMQIFNFEKYPQ